MLLDEAQNNVGNVEASKCSCRFRLLCRPVPNAPRIALTIAKHYILVDRYFSTNALSQKLIDVKVEYLLQRTDHRGRFA